MIIEVKQEPLQLTFHEIRTGETFVELAPNQGWSQAGVLLKLSDTEVISLHTGVRWPITNPKRNMYRVKKLTVEV